MKWWLSLRYQENTLSLIEVRKTAIQVSNISVIKKDKKF